jgi:cytochrome P450
MRGLATRDGLANPHRIFSALREAGAMHDAPHYGPALTRYSDVRQVLFDRTLKVSAAAAKQGSARANISERMPPDLRALPPWLFLMDEPDHSRLRKLIAPFFNQRSIDGLKPKIVRNANALLTSLAPRSDFDLVADFAIPLPLYVIGDLLGVDRRDREQLRHWSEALVYQLHSLASADRYETAVEGHRALASLFRRLIGKRRIAPRSDVISYLVAAEKRGELSEDEIVSLSVNLLVAGHLTTADLIASLSYLVLRHPEQRRLLVNNPALWPNAIEEALRLEPPTPLLARVHACPAQRHGRDFQTGDTINVFIASANRDPQIFADPDRFDVHRRHNAHLSFGGGGHFCLGAPLARAEALIAIRLLFERLPTLALADEEFDWRPNPNFRGLTRLKVENANMRPVSLLQPAALELG